MTTPAPLRIVMVDLLDESLKSHRVLHDGDPYLYPILVGLSRSVDEYERKELSEYGIVRLNDRMFARIENVTLEHVRDMIDHYNEVFASAVERARVTREAAQAEDQRLTQLALKLSNQLRTALTDQ